MKYNKLYICDFLKFFIERNQDYPSFLSKDYIVDFHPTNGFSRTPVLSRQDLKGLADFIYESIGEKK
jgi:hypothetical protein